MTFSTAEAAACRRLIDLALKEDLSTAGDLTTSALIPPEKQGQAAVVAHASGVVAGLPIVALAAAAVDATLNAQPLLEDGVTVRTGKRIALLKGSLASILVVERTLLNFLQRLSGIATLTHRYVDAVAGLRCHIFDTRKTTPGWRLLEKYAVRCGGGHNHRIGLFDGVLIKDNHLASLFGQGDEVESAVQRVREKYVDRYPIEIEVDNLEQLGRALSVNPNIVLLDNMSLHDLTEAVRRRNVSAPDVLLEASGGVTLGTVRAIAETGVDRISVGALTHSATALDLALDYVPT